MGGLCYYDGRFLGTSKTRDLALSDFAFYDPEQFYGRETVTQTFPLFLPLSKWRAGLRLEGKRHPFMRLCAAFPARSCSFVLSELGVELRHHPDEVASELNGYLEDTPCIFKTTRGDIRMGPLDTWDVSTVLYPVDLRTYRIFTYQDRSDDLVADLKEEFPRTCIHVGGTLLAFHAADELMVKLKYG